MKSTFSFEYYAEPPQRTDMVVFVHGLIGDLVRTWGAFPSLLDTDPYLPNLDILMCGYRSRLLRWDPDIPRAGKRLISALEQEAEPDAHIFLVGHSMGGLIILSGLVDACRDGRAQQLPVNKVEWVTLIASPTLGSEAAAGHKYLLNVLRFFPLRWIAWLLASRQVRQLARGTFVDDLMREVVYRLYCTDISPADANARCFVNVRIVLGDEDHVVAESSGRGVFYRLAPKRVSGTHSTVKEPKDHRDPRYRAVANDIAGCLRSDFTALCARCLAGEAEAQAIFDHRWGRAIEYRLTLGFPNEPNVSERRESLRSMTWKSAVERPELAPGRAFDNALMMLTPHGAR